MRFMALLLTLAVLVSPAFAQVNDFDTKFQAFKDAPSPDKYKGFYKKDEEYFDVKYWRKLSLSQLQELRSYLKDNPSDYEAFYTFKAGVVRLIARKEAAKGNISTATSLIEDVMNITWDGEPVSPIFQLQYYGSFNNHYSQQELTTVVEGYQSSHGLVPLTKWKVTDLIEAIDPSVAVTVTTDYIKSNADSAPSLVNNDLVSLVTSFVAEGHMTPQKAYDLMGVIQVKSWNRYMILSDQTTPEAKELEQAVSRVKSMRQNFAEVYNVN